MLTALSVAKDCGIIPCGERVVLVHSTHKNASSPPVLSYTDCNYAVPQSVIVNLRIYLSCGND